MKVTIHRQTGATEEITVQCDLQRPSDWPEKVAPVFAYLDDRLAEQGKRMFQFNQTLNTLTNEEHAKFSNLYYILMGRAIPPRVGDEPTVEGVAE